MSSTLGRAGRALGANLLLLLVAGCAWNKATVVLLSDKDAAAVTVKQGEQEIVLDRPYAAYRENRLFGPQSYTSSADEVQTQFGTALAAQPKGPKTYTVYFVEGSEEFTAESRQHIDEVLSEIATYPVPDIVVVGHTDAVGSDPYNDALSLRRAETVRTALIGRGVAPENVVAVGRGKRQPFRSTPGVLADPVNRRVEIIVR